MVIGVVCGGAMNGYTTKHEIACIMKWMENGKCFFQEPVAGFSFELFFWEIFSRSNKSQKFIDTRYFD